MYPAHCEGVRVFLNFSNACLNCSGSGPVLSRRYSSETGLVASFPDQRLSTTAGVPATNHDQLSAMRALPDSVLKTCGRITIRALELRFVISDSLNKPSSRR